MVNNNVKHNVQQRRQNQVMEIACEQIPGSDAPLTLPVYTFPSGLSYMPGQSSVQTVLASGVSSRLEGWSSATAQSAGMAREGLAGASAPPMETEDGLLVTKGLPGCPYRFTSYNGPAISDMNPAFGLQFHHPRFLEFIGAIESACLLYRSPTFWVDRLGEEQAMAAAVNLQRDAGIMLSNLQIMSQFVPYIRDRRLVCCTSGDAGRPHTWRRWVCGAPRRVQVIPGQCRPRPATLA